MSDCQAGAGFQLCGRSSAIRLMGWVAMRESTSLNQAKGSTPARWQDAVKLRRMAAVVPPRSLPKNIQFLRLSKYFDSRNYVQVRIMCSPEQRNHTIMRIDGSFKRPVSPSRCA